MASGSWRAGHTVPLPPGVQSIVGSLKAAWKNKLKAANTARGVADHYQTAARVYSTRPMNEPWKTLR